MKKMMLFISLCLAFTACANRNNTYDQRRDYNRNCDQRNGDCDDDYSDSGITYRVKQALMTNSRLSASSRLVSVTTYDGVVTLTGTVPNSSEMSEVVATVKNVRGVKSVDNQMTISNR